MQLIEHRVRTGKGAILLYIAVHAQAFNILLIQSALPARNFHISKAMEGKTGIPCFHTISFAGIAVFLPCNCWCTRSAIAVLYLGSYRGHYIELAIAVYLFSIT